MGTGKTAVAKAVAGKTGLRYISTDGLIEKKQGMPINDIFAKKGEPFFRDAEKEAVREISKEEGLVIDAGGGVVLDEENVKNLKKTGILVCLWAKPEAILERVKSHTHRPLLNVSDPKKKIEDLLSKRKPFYERADYHVETSKLSVEEVARGVIKYYEEHRK